MEQIKQVHVTEKNYIFKTTRDFVMLSKKQDIAPDVPYQFTMSVRHKYFEMIKSGQKDI